MRRIAQLHGDSEVEPGGPAAKTRNAHAADLHCRRRTKDSVRAIAKYFKLEISWVKFFAAAQSPFVVGKGGVGTAAGPHRTPKSLPRCAMGRAAHIAQTAHYP